MTWVRTPDTALSSPQMLALPRGARLLYLELLHWRNLHLSELLADDLVPEAAVRMTDEPDPEQALAALLDAGALIRAHGGYRLAWWIEYQPTRKEAQDKRRSDNARQKRRTRHLAGDHSLCDPERCHALLRSKDHGVSHGVTEGVSHGVNPGFSDPTRPDQRKGSRRGGSGAAESAALTGAAAAPAHEWTEAEIDALTWAQMADLPQSDLLQVAEGLQCARCRLMLFDTFDEYDWPEGDDYEGPPFCASCLGLYTSRRRHGEHGCFALTKDGGKPCRQKPRDGALWCQYHEDPQSRGASDENLDAIHAARLEWAAKKEAETPAPTTTTTTEPPKLEIVKQEPEPVPPMDGLPW